MVLTKLKMAVFVPIPSASTATAAIVKPGAFQSWRKANLKSWIIWVVRWGLFCTQSFDWVDMCRAARRNQTSEQRRDCQHDRGRAEQQWIVRRNLVKLRRQQTADGKCAGQTNNQTKDYGIHSLPHHQTQHIRRLRAQRHAHTNLTGAHGAGRADDGCAASGGAAGNESRNPWFDYWSGRNICRRPFAGGATLPDFAAQSIAARRDRYRAGSRGAARLFDSGAPRDTCRPNRSFAYRITPTGTTHMIQEFRFAFRQLWKAPGFTIAAVAVLALGIGTNTAIFSLVNTMLFKPPAYKQSSEIVQLFSQDKKNPKSFRSFSYPTYCDVREQNTVFSGVLAHYDTIVGLGEKGNTRRTLADLVSSNYFSVLGVLPAYGRAFLPEEEKPGPDERVAIVSYRFWQKHSRDPSLLGQSLLINGRPFTVVGIMPEGFTGITSIFSPEVWLPLGVHDDIANDLGSTRTHSLADRGVNNLMVIGRLKPGVTAEAAAPVLKGLAANRETAFPVEQKNQTFMTAPLFRFDTITDPAEAGPVNTIGALLTGMAAVVLLVACLNLANMLLARGTARRKEIAIRLALGGSRARIVR